MRSDERFNFENNLSKPGTNTNTDDISRAEDSCYQDDLNQSSEYVPKTVEEVEEHIDYVIGAMVKDQRKLNQV